MVLAYGLHNFLNKPFVRLLFEVNNEKCLNLSSTIVQEKPSVCEEKIVRPFNRAVLLDHYNLMNVVNFDEADSVRNGLIQDMHREWDFQSRNLRIRGGSYGQYSVTHTAEPFFKRPELHSFYVFEKQLYSIYGLLRHNNLDEYLYPLYPSRDPNAETYQPFSTYAPLPGGKKHLRPLHLQEWFAVSEKKYEEVVTYQLTLNQNTYGNVYHLIRDNEIKNWHKYPDSSLFDRVFELIKFYLSASSHKQLFDAIDRWSDALMRPESPKLDFSEWIKKVNCLYGQSIETNGVESTFFIEWLLSVRYFLPQLWSRQPKLLAAELACCFERLTRWYCLFSSRDHTVLKRRQDAVLNLFTERATLIRDTEQDYFNLSHPRETHYERLAHLSASYHIFGGKQLTAYHILLPSLKNSTNAEITDCILNHNDNSLINLKPCYAKYLENKQVLNVTVTPPRAFTAKELDRIARNPRYKELALVAWMKEAARSNVGLQTLLTHNLFVSPVNYLETEEVRANSPALSVPGGGKV